MELLPLKYAASSLTIYHAIALVVIASLPFLGGAADGAGAATRQAVVNICIFSILYFLAAPIVGQLYGDKYSWTQVWPSGFLLALLLMTWGNFAFWSRDSEYPLSSALFFWTVGTLVFGLFMSLSLWLMPRVPGWGVITFPRKACGVSL